MENILALSLGLLGLSFLKPKGFMQTGGQAKPKRLPRQKSAISPTTMKLLTPVEIEISSTPTTSSTWNRDVGPAGGFVENEPTQIEIKLDNKTYFVNKDKTIGIMGTNTSAALSAIVCRTDLDPLALVNGIPTIVHLIGLLWLNPSQSLRRCIKGYLGGLNKEKQETFNRIGVLVRPKVTLAEARAQ